MKAIKIAFKIIRWMVKITMFIFLIPLRLLGGVLNDRYDPWNPDSPYHS